MTIISGNPLSPGLAGSDPGCGAVVLGLKAIFQHALKLNQGPFHAFFDKRF